MTTSAKAVRFDENSMEIDLSDSLATGIPSARFPRLLPAQPEQRQQCALSVNGIHWDKPDESISITGLLARLGDPIHLNKIAA